MAAAAELMVVLVFTLCWMMRTDRCFWGIFSGWQSC